MIDNYPTSLTELHDCLVEAAETERRLPAALRKQKLASWVDIQPEWLAYADTNKHNTLGRASARQIARYDEILLSIATLKHTEDRLLLWRVAHSAAFKRRGPPWLKLSKLMHCDRRTVKARYQDALIRWYYHRKQNTRFGKIAVAE